MATELHNDPTIQLRWEWEDVPTIYPICNDIDMQIRLTGDVNFDFRDKDLFNCVHEIEPGIFIFFDEDSLVGAAIVIARREDFINYNYENYSYIIAKKRVSGYRNRIALELKRLKLRSLCVYMCIRCNVYCILR